MLLERLPRAGGQVHSEGAPQEGGGMVWGSASQQGALTREGGGDGGAENPTVGCA